ncbi:hypothetical protein IQ268_23985 [Oculatella sp. LEGE 06141]|nr:hypothetical protein [Oculatella sp. LEGE 06141]
MQLLNSWQNQRLDQLPDQLQTALEDIVHQLQIDSTFCIRHPAYKPLELPDDAIDRFQQLPADLQHKYLSLQLRSFLYGIYYNGAYKEILTLDADTDDSMLHQNLENNTFQGVDLAFYERLHQSNRGTGYFDLGWQIVRQEDETHWVVFKNGLTLHIERDRHLQPHDHTAAIGDAVAIRLPRNRLQNGFYMAIGNTNPSREHHERSPQTVRIYFNLSPDGAVAVMDSLTQQLNEQCLPFSFKVLYNPSDYGRYDSGVLYFDKGYYQAVKRVLQAVYLEHQLHFRPEVPLFTKQLAPGLALAEEPDQKFADQESFGMNRCQIVADALLEARHQEKTAPGDRMAAIFTQFSTLGIELWRSHLNASSDDIYTPLDL